TSSMSRHLESCKKKPCLEAGQQKLTFAKVTHNDKLRLHTLLEKWIIRDQQSLSVLDHPDFRVLLHALLAGYEPPTRNIMTRKIGVDFDVLKSQVKAELQAIPGRVALTTDGWTAGNGDQFQCITAHFIDGSWNLKTVLLDFAPFPVPHTAENAANLISAALEEFGITDKVSGCVTDNTASAYNISTILKRRMSPSPFLPARCASHLINLVVKHGLEDAGRDEIFGACRAFVTLLHRSKPTEKALVDACEEVGVKYVVPPTVMEVRWNSTLAQLAGLQRLEVALRHLFETPAYKNNAWAEPVWLAMRDIIKILTIFKDVSDHLQGRKFPTLSCAAEGFVLITKGLEELNVSRTLTSWGSEVLGLFQTRLREYREHLIDASVVQWATILDPSMKESVIEADGVQDLSQVTDDLEHHLECYYPIAAVSPVAPHASSAAISPYEKLRQRHAPPSNSSISITARKQLEAYLREPKILSPAPADALHYWMVNEARFP
ncbi:hypothetical protein CF319_g9430, partial [Tilletia indica]